MDLKESFKKQTNKQQKKKKPQISDESLSKSGAIMRLFIKN